MTPINIYLQAKAFRNTVLVVPSYKGAVRSTFKLTYFKLKRSQYSEILKVSKEPNLRCLDCGWKYNLDRISYCPSCKSDRSRLFLDDDPFMNPGYWLFALVVTGIILRASYWLLHI